MGRHPGNRILVVEDEASVRRLIVRWLHRNGFVTFEADHANRALFWSRRRVHGIDLAIIDLMGTDGLDLAAELTRAARHIHVLYISGYGDSLAVEAIGRRSPEALLLKPFKEGDLIGRVRRLLGIQADAASETGSLIQQRTGAFRRRCG